MHDLNNHFAKQLAENSISPKLFYLMYPEALTTDEGGWRVCAINATSLNSLQLDLVDYVFDGMSYDDVMPKYIHKNNVKQK